MAPTVQSSSSNDRKQRPGEKKSDLVCRVKYCNTLPDIPFDPKFITYPFPSNRFVDYKPTSLERNYKYDLLTEHDLGVTIDLINPDTYAIDPQAALHPDDDRLLEEDALTPQDSKRSRHHNKTVPWLKKTEYISNEFNRYGHSSEKTETKVGYNVKKLFKEENLYMDRESQITAINKTFSDAKIPIEHHYSKPNVFAVEELPLFPDFQLWRYPFAQVIFDAEPVPGDKTDDMMTEMSQAMIRGVVDDSGEQFVAYFLPTEETLKKRKRDADEGMEYEDEEVYEYKMAREYNWNVKNKATKGYEENYFFVAREGCMYYNELETRVRLNKRRLKPGAQTNTNSKLVVKHRPLNESEFNTQEFRMQNLEQPPEEEEEEEETREVEENAEEEEEEKENEEEEENKESDDEARGSASSESEAEEKADEGSDAEEGKAGSVKSKSSSSSSSAASSSSSSSSEAEDEDRNKRDEEEIFGSDSD